jgi:hypothetical protein
VYIHKCIGKEGEGQRDRGTEGQGKRGVEGEGGRQRQKQRDSGVETYM